LRNIREERLHSFIKELGITESIKVAFDLGVFISQQGDRNIFDIGIELQEMIHLNIYEAYGGIYPNDLLSNNVEYFLQIALLGYILPGVCVYDEEMKNKLFTLMQAKIAQAVDDKDKRH